MRTRRPNGLNHRVVAMARLGRDAAAIAMALDCSEPYVRATCRRAGVTLRGKRAARNEAPPATADSRAAESGPGRFLPKLAGVGARTGSAAGRSLPERR